MSIHRSLKASGALRRSRNVLRRVERLEKLKEQARWSEEDSVFGLPKVRTQFKTANPKKKKKAEEAAAAETTEAEASES